MKLGYMARGMVGETIHLTDVNRHPRGQLLEACGRKRAVKLWNDTYDGGRRHTGYIVGGNWFEIYEVHSWGKKEA